MGNPISRFNDRQSPVLTHTPDPDRHDLKDDINPHDVIANKGCDVFCHGHTHCPNIEFKNEVLILNPGHLKADVDRGYPASFAEIKLRESTCDIQIIQLNSGDCLHSIQLTK